jgi:rare lipoprotein A
MKIKAGLILLILQFPLMSGHGHASDFTYSEIGAASWYGSKHHGKQTASGERFNMNDYTAAHRSLPIGTIVRVLNPRNGREVLVRVNDRGPFDKKRIIDLSRAAARVIGLVRVGVAKVKVEVISMPEASYSFNSR